MPTSEKSIATILRLAAKLFAAFEDAGGSHTEADTLGESPELMRGILGVLRGTHELKPKFTTWRTARRGVYKTLEVYLAALEAKGYKVETYAGQTLPKVVWAQEYGEEELVLVLDHDLGLKEGYTLDELTAAAAKFDLHRLDADVAAGLREQYDDQPIDEWVLCAMDPIADSDWDLEVFDVGRDAGGVFLYARCANPEYRFFLGRVWVLSRRKR